MRGKYLCAARYNGAKCGGRVRTYGFLCRNCEEDREFERKMAARNYVYGLKR